MTHPTTTTTQMGQSMHDPIDIVHDPLCIHMHHYVEDVIHMLYGDFTHVIDANEIWGPVFVPIALIQ